MFSYRQLKEYMQIIYFLILSLFNLLRFFLFVITLLRKLVAVSNRISVHFPLTLIGNLWLTPVVLGLRLCEGESAIRAVRSAHILILVIIVDTTAVLSDTDNNAPLRCTVVASTTDRIPWSQTFRCTLLTAPSRRNIWGVCDCVCYLSHRNPNNCA